MLVGCLGCRHRPMRKLITRRLCSHLTRVRSLIHPPILSPLSFTTVNHHVFTQELVRLKQALNKPSSMNQAHTSSTAMISSSTTMTISSSPTATASTGRGDFGAGMGGERTPSPSIAAGRGWGTATPVYDIDLTEDDENLEKPRHRGSALIGSPLSRIHEERRSELSVDSGGNNSAVVRSTHRQSSSASADTADDNENVTMADAGRTSNREEENNGRWAWGPAPASVAITPPHTPPGRNGLAVGRNPFARVPGSGSRRRSPRAPSNLSEGSSDASTVVDESERPSQVATSPAGRQPRSPASHAARYGATRGAMFVSSDSHESDTHSEASSTAVLPPLPQSLSPRGGDGHGCDSDLAPIPPVAAGSPAGRARE